MIFLVWSGHGYVVPWMVAMSVALALVAGEALGLSEAYVLAAGFLLAAAVCWKTGRRLNDPAKGRRMIDAATGQTVTLRERHSLFGIEVQWWAVPCVIAALWNGMRGVMLG